MIEKLGESVCEHLLFAYAILLCDTTSRLFGIGTAVGQTILKDNDIFCQQAVVLEKRLWYVSTQANQQIRSIPSDF